MNGIKEQKAGKIEIPSIWTTFLQAIRLTLFQERSFIIIFIDKRLTLNLISIFFLMFLIPVKNSFDNKILFSPEKFIESFLITLIYVCILYLFVIHRKISFLGFLRIFMAMETVDILNIFSLFLSGYVLKGLIIVVLSWYLSLSVITISRLGSISYLKATFVVISTFLFVNIIPAIF
jgi:hypothetical protein